MENEWTARDLSSFLEHVNDDGSYDGERIERYVEVIATSLVGIFRQLEILIRGNDENV